MMIGLDVSLNASTPRHRNHVQNLERHAKPVQHLIREELQRVFVHSLWAQEVAE